MGLPSESELFVINLVFWFLFLLPIIIHFKQKKVLLENKRLNKTKKVPFLYSWISLSFGFFVPILRGDIKWFLIYLIPIILYFINPLLVFSNIVIAFFYNKRYIKDLIQKGYEPADENSKKLLLSKHIIDKD